MMIRDPRLGALARESNIPPSLTPFPPWIYFSKVSIKFYASHYLEDFHFVPPSCLDGSHQGDIVAHNTTHDEYLQ
jgi:hypothetical protein